jgi:cytochrome c-type biogenesis protein
MIADIANTGLSSWWAPLVAFAAGILSCASPCVWPLLPGYLSFVSGEHIAEGRAEGRTVAEAAETVRHPLTPMLLFVLGFSIVFVSLGAFASTFLEAFRGPTGQLIAGVIVMVFGALTIVIALGWGSALLYRERRPFLEKVRPGPVSAVPLGMAFAIGWTPCIGPVLGAIIAMAQSGGAARGTFLLVCYSVGFGVPFVAVGLGVTKLMDTFGAIRRHYRAIGTASGAILIMVGALIASGTFTRLLAPLFSRGFQGL